MIKSAMLAFVVMLGGCTAGVSRPPARAFGPVPDERGAWALVGPGEAMQADAAVLSEYNAEYGRRDMALQTGKWEGPVRATLYDVDTQPSLADVRRLWLPCDPRTVLYNDPRWQNDRGCWRDPGCWWVR